MVKIVNPAVVTHSLIVPEHVERARETWQYKVVEATRGNQSMMGCILMAAMGKSPTNPPRFSVERGAVIVAGELAAKLGRKDGDILADFQAKPFEPFRATLVYNVQEFVHDFNWLADDLKLTDDERIAMFEMLRGWIAKDHSATSTTEVGEQ